MLQSFLLSCAQAFLLILWFDTTVIAHYAKLFRLNKLLKTDEFLEARKEDDSLDYSLFLYQKKPGFLTKLISCPICVTTWLSIFTSLHIGFIYFGFLALTTLGLYHIMNLLIESTEK